MAGLNYERWWSLHLRVAKGEPLSEQERIEYDLGQRLLDEQPEFSGGDTLDHLRTLRTAIDRASSLHAELTTRSAELDKKIDGLEVTFQRLTGYSLSPESHVPA